MPVPTRTEDHPTSAQKIAMTKIKITLNGEPAVLSGIRNQFATVTQSRTGLKAEWSWEAVRNVIRKGGRFES